jgi:hypothetical protein
MTKSSDKLNPLVSMDPESNTQIIIYFNMNNLFLLKLNLDSYRKSQNLLRQNKIKINMKIK